MSGLLALPLTATPPFLRIAGVLCGLAAVPGCQPSERSAAATDATVLAVTQLLYSDRCSSSDQPPAYRLIRDRSGFERWLAARHSDSVFKTGYSIDFQRELLAVADIGPQSLAGSSIVLLEPRVTVQSAQVTLSIERLAPPPGRRLPQVLTHPCAVYRLPADGYEQLIFSDHQGQTLAVLENPPR